MAPVSPQALDAAQAAYDALGAALKVARSGDVAVSDLPELPQVVIRVDPAVFPSADVAASTAEAERARQKFAAETEVRKALSIILAVGVEIGQTLMPFLGALLPKV